MPHGTIVDSNVRLDVLTEDDRWADWSADHLARAFDEGPVIVNPIVHAELSVGFTRFEDLDEALPARIEREGLPWGGAFLAGRLFVQYRRRGGPKRSPLPDFSIAAHAVVTDRTLLTRDRARHIDLLAALTVISPD